MRRACQKGGIGPSSTALEGLHYRGFRQGCPHNHIGKQFYPGANLTETQDSPKHKLWWIIISPGYGNPKQELVHLGSDGIQIPCSHLQHSERGTGM